MANKKAINNFDLKEKLKTFSVEDENKILADFNQTKNGFDDESVEIMREKYGENTLELKKEVSIFMRFMHCLFTPFNIVLMILMGVSYVTDVVMEPKTQQDYSKIVIILIMVVLSTLVRFIQELKSSQEAKKLNQFVETTVSICRQEMGYVELPTSQVVVGDIIRLAAGDMIPADLRIIESKDLFVSQSSLSGESEPVEKIAKTLDNAKEVVTDSSNLVFMGSNVISGSAIGVVIGVGSQTLLGSMSSLFNQPKEPTSFDEGMASVTKTLVSFMLVMIPIVFFLNGLTKHDWMSAFLFAVSIAIGMTPEMLPMIVTSCLAKGAYVMSKKKTIIKDLNVIQNFGAMDVLCTDKTGTLTQDKVALEYHLDVLGNEDVRVLKHAFLNSYFQTGLKNLLDIAIIERTMEVNELASLSKIYEKVDEIPFDFHRRLMSVVVKDKENKTQMITKGAIEEILKICDYVDINQNIVVLDENRKKEIINKVNHYNKKGLRVLGVAQKTNPKDVGMFSIADENEMVLIGYLAFLDPPKESAKNAVSTLKKYGTNVKVLTGDNDQVTRSVCKQVGIQVDKVILGPEIDMMDDSQLSITVETHNVFAKLTPDQKARIVEHLKKNGHTVGFMGDGINDAMAMKKADVGISVDTAVDIAKETADVILLEKDLMVLEEGVLEGRRTYANMMKYMKITASSSFGNMFSVLCASAFLPFLPMTAIQLILLSLVYDLCCVAIPWDNVDDDLLEKPRLWEAKSIKNFMIWMGPISSIFDIITYLALYFIIVPMAVGGQYHQLDSHQMILFISMFQTGWFIESMCTQTLVIHTLRSKYLPFIQTKASHLVTVLSILGIVVLMVIPSTAIGDIIGLEEMTLEYYWFLFVIVVCYLLFTTIVKHFYVKKYGDLL